MTSCMAAGKSFALLSFSVVSSTAEASAPEMFDSCSVLASKLISIV